MLDALFKACSAAPNWPKEKKKQKLMHLLKFWIKNQINITTTGYQRNVIVEIFRLYSTFWLVCKILNDLAHLPCCDFVSSRKEYFSRVPFDQTANEYFGNKVLN